MNPWVAPLGMLVLLFGITVALAFSLRNELDEKNARIDQLERYGYALERAYCQPQKCDMAWHDRSSGRQTVHVDGPAPVGCAERGQTLWVSPESKSSFTFACLPQGDEGLRPAEE